MTNKKVLSLKWLSQWLFRSLALLMLGILIAFFISKQTISQVDKFRSKIESVLSENSGMEVSLGPISGEWPRSVPIMEFSTLEIIDSDQNSAIVMENVRAELDLVRSIRHWNPVWRELVIDRLFITMVEDSSGRWGLKSLKGDEESSLSDLLEPFIHSRLLQLEKIEIDFEFFSGANAKIQGASVKIENDGNFHRSEMSIYLFDQTRPSSFLLEGYGDLSNISDFSAKGYINIQDFDISTPLAELASSLQPKILGELEQLNAGVNSEVWIDIKPGANITFKGTMSASDVATNWLADLPDIKNIRSDISGWYTPQKDWGFRFQDLFLEWIEAEILPFDLIFRQKLGYQWEDFDVSISEINLSRLNKILSKTQVLNNEILQALNKLSPRGALSDLNFGNNDAGHYASVNIKELDIAPFKGIPGMRGVDGYLEIESSKGLFNLHDDNGLELFFPGVYKDFLPIKTAKGTIHIQHIDSAKKLRIKSSIIDAKFGAGNASFLFSLEQDQFSKKTPPEVLLLIGSSGLDLAYSEKYLPYKLSPSVLNWLSSSNLKGNIKQFGLVQRSGADSHKNRILTTQLLFDAEGADLDYHPLWPAMRNFDAVVLIDDRLTQGQVFRGDVGNVAIEQADIELGKHPIGHRKSKLMTINGNLTSSVNQSIDFLAKSPLASSIGNLVDWDYKGHVNTKISLEIPLGRPNKDRSQGQYKVESLLSAASLNIGNTPLKIDNINGILNFTNEKGLHSELIKGSLWGESFEAKIFQDNNIQKILLDTSVKPSSLGGLVDFPWADVVSGIIPLKGTLTLKPLKNKLDKNISLNQKSALTLMLKSDLLGNEIRLPEPFNKKKNEKRDLALKFHFDSKLTRIESTVGDDFVTDLRFDSEGFTRGLASFDTTTAMPSGNELLIAASLSEVDVKDWAPWLKQFSDPALLEEKSWTPILDLNFKSFKFSNVEFKDFESRTIFGDDGIEIKFSSHLGDGVLLMPQLADDFPQLNLTRLSISDDLLISQIEERRLDPREFIDADIAIDSINVSGKSWGDIAFQLRSSSSGAAFRNIQGDIFSLKPGLMTNKETSFFWGFNGDRYTSSIRGPVGIENMSDFFHRFDVDPPIDSTNGNINFDLTWQALPWELTKDNLTGNVEINLSQGNFYTSPGGGSAALKLVSLFNFANWLRRLQLDFSDVVGENLAYNNLVGKIEFDKGIASLLQPLQVEMPSGRMSLAGDFNLLAESANAQVVATLPVATNLPWVVAILGNVPAAAGVYLTSKLVSEQVDRLSSISYQINGPWDDLEISVDEIFAGQLDNKSTDKSSSRDLINN